MTGSGGRPGDDTAELDLALAAVTATTRLLVGQQGDKVAPALPLGRAGRGFAGTS